MVRNPSPRFTCSRLSPTAESWLKSMSHLRIDRAQHFALILVVLSLLVLTAAAATAAAQATCASSQPTAYPTASISNRLVDATVYLPDARDGYYRGTRFDWSGVIGCLAFKGHSYFGVWFPHYDPLLNDAISGPVEEFRSADWESSLAYDRARPGDPFVKIGVGVLRKIDDKPYQFATAYPIIDLGKWTTRATASGVSFQQILHSPIGIAYVYKKTLKLDPHQPVLILQHELKNTGTESIDTQVYNHDFYVLDNAPTGPDMAVRFPFAPIAQQPLQNGAHIEGNQIHFQRPFEIGEFVFTPLTGFSNSPSDYDFVVENAKTGVGVEQTGDLSISRINFWSIRTTICPEAYLHLKIAPGQTARWTIRYRFYAR